MSKRKTNEEFVAELKEKNPTVEPMEKYETAVRKIKVRCSVCRNIWETTPSSLLFGRGCPECGKKKIGNALRKNNSDFLEDLAEVNSNIEALEEYKGSTQKITFRCRICGNTWRANPRDILSGHGCPKCGYERQKNMQRYSHDAFLANLEEINKDIDVLDKYINNHTKLRFQCRKCGHIWSTVPNSVLLGHGCPNCARSSTSFLEQAILQAFIIALGEKEVLARDRTLIGMELDIVIPSKKIAFEPGSWVWHYNKHKRDELKRKKCTEKGYKLITIYTDFKDRVKPFETDCYTSPYTLGNPDWEEVKKLVEVLLAEQNLSISSEQMETIRNLAIEKSKKKTTAEYVESVQAINPNILVIGEYADNSSRIEHQCLICGRKWFAVPGSILSGHGCPTCAILRSSAARRMTHDDFVASVISINPKVCVLGRYINSKTKIRCKCIDCGRVWETTPNILLKGQGCPDCGRKRATQKNSKTHEQFVDELRNKNPSLRVIGEYINSSTKIGIECTKCANQWYANPMDILRGHGCPICAGSIKKTNEQFLAELHQLFPEIEPLEEYRSANEKINVKCRICNYTWLVRPHDLLRSKGCPKCRKNKDR